MVSTDLAAPSTEIRTANVKRVRLLPLVALIFFSVSGGAYGIESLFSTSGPGIGILLILATPILYAVPHSLVVSELGTAIPEEGGYYHWVKRGLGASTRASSRACCSGSAASWTWPPTR